MLCYDLLFTDVIEWPAMASLAGQVTRLLNLSMSDNIV